jgi:hypothetical protein
VTHPITKSIFCCLFRVAYICSSISILASEESRYAFSTWILRFLEVPLLSSLMMMIKVVAMNSPTKIQKRTMKK